MATKSINATGVAYLISKIKETFFAKSDALLVSSISIDNAPTSNSSNLVTSGGVKNAITAIQTSMPPNLCFSLMELSGSFTPDIEDRYYYTFNVSNNSAIILNFDVDTNSQDNYILVHNIGSSAITISITSLNSNIDVIGDAAIEIPAGGYSEIGIILSRINGSAQVPSQIYIVTHIELE